MKERFSWNTALRPLTGKDGQVIEFLDASVSVQRMYGDILGFLAVGGFYAAMSILVYLLRERIDAPILKKFSSIFFAD